MTPGAGRALRMAYLVASLAGVGFFAMSVALLGVWPGRVLDEQTRRLAPERPLPPTAAERRGRAVYGREGCAYCHTQQVRYVHADMQRFGAPTLAWETARDYPHLWGTRRIGPDLTRAGLVRTDDWHFAHLFAPRSVVADSVMPAYRVLFDGGPDRPLPAARDLVAYLQSLGRARELAGPEGQDRAKQRCECPDDEMAQMAFTGPLNASPARPRRAGSGPVLRADADQARGRVLYAANCASCHGPSGEGDGPGAVALSPRPSALAEHEYTPARISDALWNGVPGTAMQAWRDLPASDRASLVAVVRGFHRAQAVTVPPGLMAIGQRVYDANCAQCHGVDGGGNGYAAPRLAIAPASFRSQRPSLDRSLRAVRDGVAGTRMAPWTGRLTNAEIVAVANYVRGFFEPDPPRGDGGGR